VADSFLGRWFGSASRPGQPAVAAAQAELDRAVAGQGGLGPLAAWLRELLPELAPEPAGPLALTAEQARDRLDAGVPLLRGEKLTVDLRAFTRRWRRACALLEKHQPDGVARALAAAIQKGRLPAEALLDAVLAGQPEAVQARAEELGLDVPLACTVLRFALFPVFTGLEQALAPLRAGAGWEQGYCPTCGSWPLLAEFRGLDQSRFLRCGLCAAGWEAPRLWCPFCGNRDHERVGYLVSAGEESKSRLFVCEECRGHLKTVTTLAALAPLSLLVVDAVTVHLDLAAAERGYLGAP
jgi:FdhE protein